MSIIGGAEPVCTRISAQGEIARMKTSNKTIHRGRKMAGIFSAIAVLILGIAGFAARLGAQQGVAETPEETAYRTAMEDADQKIVAENQAHSEMMKNLEYLTTQIGPRLTGSPQMQAASKWTLKRFQDYGIDAHLETTQVAHSWTRGMDTAEITAPIQRRVGVRSAGWSKATSGAVTGPVVVMEAQTPEAIAAMGSKLKGAIVLLGRPANVSLDLDPSIENAYDAVIPPARGIPAARGGGAAGGRGARGGGGGGRGAATNPLADAGVAVVLRDSGKPFNLFNMGGAGGGYDGSAYPTAFMTHEDYSLIYRLAQAGPVTMNVNLTGVFSPGPQDASITVAEIKGSQFPDERVIVGGHLDSWDLGQGAVDNGTGAMATMEAARILKSLGWKPKRTLTFILFTGEEEGGVGVQTFMRNHAAEVPKMDAVLVHDTGTGKVLSIALENLYDTAPQLSEVYTPMREILDLQPLSTRYFGSSDHVSFLRAGVATYFCIQAPAHYREDHHSQADTFDKVIPDQANQGAQLLAMFAWNVSEMTKPFPHHEAVPAPNAGVPGR
jgi:carboxypeptidase Q